MEIRSVFSDKLAIYFGEETCVLRASIIRMMELFAESIRSE